MLRIVDQGAGILHEHIPFLFEKFSKIVRRSGTLGEPSTGLGLSIVKHLVDLHNGTIYVESELGKGTTIAINFLNNYSEKPAKTFESRSYGEPSLLLVEI